MSVAGQYPPCNHGVSFGKTDSLAAGWAVLCLVLAGYANLNGPQPTADTAVMRIWAVKHRNLGHLIRTRGGGVLMGLGFHPVGLIHNWPPSGVKQPIACRGGVRGLWFVHSQQQYQSWARGAGMMVHAHAAAAAVHVSLMGSS